MFFLLLNLLSKIPFFTGKGRIFKFIITQYLKRGTPLVEVNGKLGKIKIDLRSLEWKYFCNRNYDEELMNEAFKLINIDSMSIDVGANIGLWTIGIAQHIKNNNGKGQVFAFEPHPKNYQRLLENIEINGLRDCVSLHNIALSNCNRTLKLVLREDFKNGGETGNASVATSDEFDKGFESIDIQACQTDDFLTNQEINKISFIKLDVEGHEDLFLEGATDLIKDHKPSICMEINIPFYKAREIDHTIAEKFTSLLPNYTFKSDQNQTNDLKELINSDLSDLFALPIK